MTLVRRALSTVRKITVVIAIAIAFLFGVGTTVYLSLRSPEVKVPNIVGKDRFEAEKILAASDLNFRIRASRPSNQTNPDVVLFQLPRAGEVVKAGQTVAMDISRVAREGETPETVKPAEEPSDNSNSTESTNTNENKPKKPKTTANKNADENANGNSNVSGNVNKPSNVNRVTSNRNINSNSETPRTDVNHEPVNPSPKPAGTPNDNNRPAVVPRPSPAVTKTPSATKTP